MFVYSEREAQAHEAITVSTDAIGITVSLLRNSMYGPCTGAFITVESANVRFRIDGSDPSTTTGHMLTNGQNLTLGNESDVGKFRAIRDDDDDATLRVTLRY